MKQRAQEMAGRDAVFLRTSERPKYEDGPQRVRVVDLFSGCGGITLGLAEAARAVGRGLDVRLAMEIDADVRSVYDRNFKPRLTTRRDDVRLRFNRSCGDPLSVAEQDTAQAVGPVDLLVGGPPCQGHSDLNNHTRRRDPKNELYMVMVRAAEVLKPGHVLIENVQGVRRDHSMVLPRAVEALESLGYRVDHGLVHLVEIGVPQTRVRHILVASRRSQPSLAAAVQRCAFPLARDLAWAIRDLEDVTPVKPLDRPSKLSSDNLERATYLQNSGEYDLPNDQRPQCHRDNPDHRYTAMYGRLRWDAPAHTITTGFGSPGQGRYLHPSLLRTLTPHEAARIQFFPDWFDFGPQTSRTVLAHCIGNAVPPKLAFVLAFDRLLAGVNAEAKTA
jgi:DNA (cytosine-5)-methyltransferase 1